jgi:hypothetical protein
MAQLNFALKKYQRADGMLVAPDSLQAREETKANPLTAWEMQFSQLPRTTECKNLCSQTVRRQI